MPPFDFPNFPTDGMVITGPGGTRFQWSQAGNRWRVPQPAQFALQSDLANYLPLTGGTMSGVLITPGVTDGSAAAPGMVGEYLLSPQGGGPLVSGSAANIAALSLTAGDWLVYGIVVTEPIGSGQVTLFSAQIGVVSGSITDPQVSLSAPFGVNTGQRFPILSPRISLSATTPIYLVAAMNFTGAVSCFGTLTARRMR